MTSRSLFRRFATGAAFLLALASVSPIPSAPRRSASVALSDQDIQRGLVLLRITPLFYNQAAPWIQEGGESYSALGLVVAGGRILALADQLRDASLVEVQNSLSARRSLARIELSDEEINLALLRPEDPQFLRGLSPLAMGGALAPGQDVVAVKIDTLFRVYRETNRIKELNAQTRTGFTVLPIAAFRTTDPFFSGLTLCGGRVCGLIQSADRERRTEAIPTSVVQAFLQRATTPATYSGFVSMGFGLAELADPVLRERLGAAGQQGGALVTRVTPGASAYGALRAGDVLLSLDGRSIDEQGFYEHPGLGRQQASLLLAAGRDGLRSPGQQVAAVVLRDGVKQSLSVRLRRYSGEGERIPSRSAGQPAYVIENGLVFVEFTAGAARQIFGNEWETRAIEFGFLYRTRRFYEKEGERDRILVLSAVLPDEANRSYDQFGGSVLETVDGKPVTGMKDLYDRIQELSDAGREYVAIGFSGDRILYLDLKNRQAINRRILQRYSIPAGSSFELDDQRR